jgi:hypothetical protein
VRDKRTSSLLWEGEGKKLAPPGTPIACFRNVGPRGATPNLNPFSQKGREARLIL